MENIESGVPAVMYTLIHGGGESGLPEGSRFLVCNNGIKYGTLGADCLNQLAEERAKVIFKDSVSQTDIVEYRLSEEAKAIILEDAYFPEKRIIIYGGGHVALPLAQMASILGYQVLVIDDRPDFASRQRFPWAHEVIYADFNDVWSEEFIKEKINPFTSVIIVTRGHEYDKTCLASVVSSQARYIGMIGSKSKVKSIFKALENEGISREDLRKIAAPIGLALGGQKPPEIALSILAEIVARENNGNGRTMREVKGGLLE